MAEIDTVPILVRREIEARILAPVFALMERDFGREKAEAILAEAVEADAVAAGRRVAEGVPKDKTLRAFIAVQPLWTAGGALDQVITAESDSEYAYTVTRCAYAEMYDRLGLKDLGEILSCRRDAKFIQGVDPAIEFERTSTIMAGDSECRFSYRLPAHQ
jgi:predicted nucleic-acid-binding Zn-ribbon protein